MLKETKTLRTAMKEDSRDALEQHGVSEHVLE